MAITSESPTNDNFLRSISKRLTISMDRYLPDAFIFALILSFIVFIMGIVIARESPFNMVTHWYNGFWNFLAFSMQMVLIVVTGHCIAQTKLVSGWISATAKLPNNPKSAVTITVLVSAFAGWLNWGLGLVVGALIAKQMAVHQKKVDFSVLVAAAYSGAFAGIFGLSITAPLLVNTPGHFLEDKIGLLPVTMTSLNPIVIISVIVMAILMAIAFRFMTPTKDEEIFCPSSIKDESENSEKETTIEDNSPANYLENSFIISAIIGIGGLVYIIYHFVTRGLDLNINIVNFTLLILGIILHKKPINYVRAVAASVKAVYGVILQFPFYAGIMGMMAGSGLIAIIAGWFVAISNPYTFPIFSFISVGLVNFFVPSAGGQWMIQGPILIEAGQALGVADFLVVNAYTYGDLSTNLIQPFWALPVLGICDLKMKDIWGYCFISFLIYTVISIVSLLVQSAIF
jgi:short-chain fatty acids transporter